MTQKKERNKMILKLKNKGWSFREIANEIGLKSASTVHEIYHREQKRLVK
jgi:lambda repressor-like predicted transcriptional regulator